MVILCTLRLLKIIVVKLLKCIRQRQRQRREQHKNEKRGSHTLWHIRQQNHRSFYFCPSERQKRQTNKKRHQRHDPKWPIDITHVCGVYLIAIWDRDVDGVFCWSDVFDARLDRNKMIGGSAV